MYDAILVEVIKCIRKFTMYYTKGLKKHFNVKHISCILNSFQNSLQDVFLLLKMIFAQKKLGGDRTRYAWNLIKYFCTANKMQNNPDFSVFNKRGK